MPDLMAQIELRMAERGITQAELARRLGTHQSQVSRWLAYGKVAYGRKGKGVDMRLNRWYAPICEILGLVVVPQEMLERRR